MKQRLPNCRKIGVNIGALLIKGSGYEPHHREGISSAWFWGIRSLAAFRRQPIYYNDIGWLPESPDRIASPKRFGKGPLISAGVQKGWLPEIGILTVLSDISLV